MAAVEHGRPVILTDHVVRVNHWAPSTNGDPGVHGLRPRDLGSLVENLRSEPLASTRHSNNRPRVTNADSPAQLKRAYENAGGHLRNTVHIAGETCERCRRNPNARWLSDLLSRCEINYPAADRVGSIIYGVDGLPGGKMMFGYKRSRAIPPLIAHALPP